MSLTDEDKKWISARFEKIDARFDRLDAYIGDFKSEVVAQLKLAEETAAIRERLSKLEEAAMAARIERLENAERLSKH